MATMLDLLGQQSVQQNTQGQLSGLDSAIKTGVGLAQVKQGMEVKQQELAAMKDQAETAKFNKLTGFLTTLSRSTPQIAKKLAPQMKAQLQAAGMPSDDIIDLASSDDQIRNNISKVSGLFAGMANDPVKRAEALSAAGDVGVFVPALDALANQSKQEQALAISRMKMDALEKQSERKVELKPTAFEKRRDEKFAATVGEFVDAGGYAGVNKQLTTLDESLATLERGKGSGGIKGMIPDVAGARDVLATEDEALKQNILGTVQGSMRATLGSQFTEKEGVGILNRAFNSRQPPKENAKRVRAIAEEIRAIAEAKQKALDYIEGDGKGSLKGYKGSTTFNIGGSKVNLDQLINPSAPPSRGAAPEAKAVANMAAAKKLAALPDKARARAALEKQLGRALLEEEAALFPTDVAGGR